MTEPKLVLRSRSFAIGRTIEEYDPWVTLAVAPQSSQSSPLFCSTRWVWTVRSRSAVASSWSTSRQRLPTAPAVSCRGCNRVTSWCTEDDQPVEITHFTAERVPVSLGIVLDTSGSMAGRKMAAARAAVRRLLVDLLGPQDEFFLYRFDHTPHLVEGWTNDRSRMSSALQRMHPEGGTALYDAVAKALPLLKSGRHRKKALLVISDGIDTSSDTRLQTLKQLIRESEALVYAIGIDAQTTTLTPFGGNGADGTIVRQQRRRPIPLPFPIPGRRPRYPPIPGTPPGPGTPQPPRMPPPNQPGPSGGGTGDEGVNEAALRDITDDSGGRSELVRDARDLDPATARIADELSKQVLPGLPESWLSRRELAHHTRGSSRPVGERQSAPGVHRGVVNVVRRDPPSRHHARQNHGIIDGLPTTLWLPNPCRRMLSAREKSMYAESFYPVKVTTHEGSTEGDFWWG